MVLLDSRVLDLTCSRPFFKTVCRHLWSWTQHCQYLEHWESIYQHHLRNEVCFLSRSVLLKSQLSPPSNSYFSMASPHVAGLAAYFLSLYPSSFVLSEEELGYTSTSSEPSTFFQHAAQFVFGQAQQWTKQRFAPIPPTHKPLTPKALKNAMVKLGTKGILTVGFISFRHRTLGDACVPMKLTPDFPPSFL